MYTFQSFKAKAEQAFEQGQMAIAREYLREIWKRKPSSATASFILNCQSRYRDIWPVRSCRVAVLRSFTVEPLVPLLRATAMLEDLDVSMEVGLLNAYSQELLEESSFLYRTQPQAAILAVQTRDLVPELWESFSSLEADEASQIVVQALSQIEGWMRAFRKQTSAQLIIHNFEQPLDLASGILDGQGSTGQAECIQRLNEGLKRLAASFESVSVLDYDGLVSRQGRENWFDPLKWATARFPIAAACMPHLAHEWLRFLYALAGPVKKVLVTALDNTLWGGSAGEDGPDGVRLGFGYSEVGYRELQEAIFDLSQRGVLLAINSKNNEADANRILEDHPGMVLRPQHFSAVRFNWQDKATNLREIAEELNVGLESLAFLDASPAERELVRMEAPEVTVVELPADPAGYAAALRSLVCFERLAISAEDRVRQQQSQQQKLRREMHQAASTLEDYFRSLHQVVTLAPLQSSALARASQLTMKTDQLRVTTKRYGEEALRDLARKPGWQVWTVNVTDRFGDNGLVGVLITRTENDICEIDSLLLSCRVIGRTVETAILAHLLAESKRNGLCEVRGVFQLTSKNMPASSIFLDHGFEEVSRHGDSSFWVFDMAGALPVCPEWIELRVTEERVMEACAAG